MRQNRWIFLISLVAPLQAFPVLATEIVFQYHAKYANPSEPKKSSNLYPASSWLLLNCIINRIRTRQYLREKDDTSGESEGRR